MNKINKKNSVSYPKLINNDNEITILFKNDELIIFQQEICYQKKETHFVKWIVTSDDEILMTRDDIGLLGDNLDKARTYESELRKGKFITPYNNPKIIKCIYPFNLFSYLKNNNRGRNPNLYEYKFITQILAELRTNKARGRNKQLGEIQEQIRTKGHYILKNSTELKFEELKKLREESKNVQSTYQSLFKEADDYSNYDGKAVGNIIANLQNKMYQAITKGYNNADLLATRPNHEKTYMNAVTFDGKNKPNKKDVQRGKTFLKQKELDFLSNSLMNSVIGWVINKNNDNETFAVNELVTFTDKVISLFSGQKFTGFSDTDSKEAKKHALAEYGKYNKLLNEIKREKLE